MQEIKNIEVQDNEGNVIARMHVANVWEQDHTVTCHFLGRCIEVPLVSLIQDGEWFIVQLSEVQDIGAVRMY